MDKARVLVLQDGLLYAGYVVPMTPPDVYGVVIDGERGSRPHIYCREELLEQSVSISYIDACSNDRGVLIQNVSMVSVSLFIHCHFMFCSIYLVIQIIYIFNVVFFLTKNYNIILKKSNREIYTFTVFVFCPSSSWKLRIVFIIHVKSNVSKI